MKVYGPQKKHYSADSFCMQFSKFRHFKAYQSIVTGFYNGSLSEKVFEPQMNMYALKVYFSKDYHCKIESDFLIPSKRQNLLSFMQGVT